MESWQQVVRCRTRFIRYLLISLMLFVSLLAVLHAVLLAVGVAFIQHQHTVKHAPTVRFTSIRFFYYETSLQLKVLFQTTTTTATTTSTQANKQANKETRKRKIGNKANYKKRKKQKLTTN